MRRFVLLAFALSLASRSMIFAAPADPPTCSYETWIWNTRSRRSEGHRRVQKSYSEISPEERDIQSGCTVCEEDQTLIEMSGVPPFKICRHHAINVRRAIDRIKDAGLPIHSISAYRVGLSKGPVNQKGQRTQFSHHSFGTAIDINSEINGLYSNCPEFNAGCRLSRGGPWRPGEPGTVTRDSIAYKAFHDAGWHWGGELVGQQKDFMHFSLFGD